MSGSSTDSDLSQLHSTTSEQICNFLRHDHLFDDAPSQRSLELSSSHSRHRVCLVLLEMAGFKIKHFECQTTFEAVVATIEVAVDHVLVPRSRLLGGRLVDQFIRQVLSVSIALCVLIKFR